MSWIGIFIEILSGLWLSEDRGRENGNHFLMDNNFFCGDINALVEVANVCTPSEYNKRYQIVLFNTVKMVRLLSELYLSNKVYRKKNEQKLTK